MKALVTGGAGFIGHYLVEKLLEAGDSVRVVDDLSKGEAKNLEKFSDLPQFEFIQADLLDPKTAIEVSEGVDIIYHLAAKIGGIGYFHKIPASLLRDNNVMTLNIFDAAKKNKIKVVYLSSSMVFEKALKFPSPEEHLLECPPPITAYGFSKLSGEYIAHAYQQEFGVPFVIVRPFNAYGPGEAPGDYVGYSHVIPDLIKKMSAEKGNTIEILGNGEQIRCFTYAEDIAEGICLLGKNAINEDFNIGTSEETRVDYLAREIWKLLGKEEELILKQTKSYDDDILRRVPDCRKIEKAYGWKPKISLGEGLKRTIDWTLKQNFN